MSPAIPQGLPSRPRTKPETNSHQDQANRDEACRHVKERPFCHCWRDDLAEQFGTHGRIHIEAKVFEVHVPDKGQDTDGKGDRDTAGNQDDSQHERDLAAINKLPPEDIDQR